MSEAMAERFWTDGDAVGRFGTAETTSPCLLVGVASDARVRMLAEAPRNMIYRPYS